MKNPAGEYGAALWNRRQAALFLNVSESSLAMDVVDGRWGVPYIKVGRCVRYSPEALTNWIASHVVSMTEAA